MLNIEILPFPQKQNQNCTFQVIFACGFSPRLHTHIRLLSHPAFAIALTSHFKRKYAIFQPTINLQSLCALPFVGTIVTT